MHLLLKTPISKIGVLAKDENMAIEESFSAIFQTVDSCLDQAAQSHSFTPEQIQVIQTKFKELSNLPLSNLPYEEQVAYDILRHRIKQTEKDLALSPPVSQQLTNLSPVILEELKNCKEAALIIQPEMEEFLVRNLIELLNDYLPKERQKLCEDIHLLFQSLPEDMDVEDKIEILSIAISWPEEGRKELFEDAACLFPYGLKKADVKNILNAASQWKDREQRKALFQDAAWLVRRGSEEEEVSSILKLVSTWPQNGRKALCDDIACLFRDSIDQKDVLALLKAASKWSETPREIRAQLFEDAAWLIHQGMSEEMVEALLKEASTYAQEGRKELFQSAYLLLRRDASIDDRAAILKAVSGFPQTEIRNRLFLDAAPLLKPGMSEKDVTAVLAAASKCPEERRSFLFNEAAPLIKRGMSEEDITTLLEIVKKRESGKKREMLFKSVAPLIQPGMSKEIVETIIEKVSMLEKNKESQQIILFVASIMCEVSTEKFLEILSKEDWTKAVEDWIPELIKLLPSYIEMQMQDENNVSKLLKIFSFIEEHYLRLGIPSEGILMNQVIACRCQIDPAVRDNKNSIYTIHQKMLAHKAEAVSSDTFLVSLEEDGKFNVGKVIEESGAKEKKRITYAELPNIDPDIFSKLFDKLSSKLTSNQKRMIEKEFGQVENELGQIEKSPRNLEKLQQILTDPSTVCYQLMHAPKGKPEEVVPVLVAKLYAIVDNILTQTDEGYVFRLPANPDGSHLLTPQEERLMAFAETMEACKEGQEERIEAIYKVLPKKESKNLSGSKSYVTKAEETVFKNLEDLRSFLKKEVDVIVRQIESMTPFMKEVISKDPKGVDPVHQTRYLKNLLKEDLGLDHNVTLDIHGQWINPGLLSMSREDVLRALFKHYQQERGENLVNDLSEYVWSSLNEKLKWMDELKQANALISATRGLEHSAATQSSSVNSMVTALQKDIQDTERNIRHCSEVLNEQTRAFSEIEGKKHKKRLQQQWEARRAAYEKKKEDLEKLLLEIKALPAKKKEATELFNAISSLLENKGISTENLFDSEKLEEEGILQLRDDPEVKRRLLIALGFLQFTSS